MYFDAKIEFFNEISGFCPLWSFLYFMLPLFCKSSPPQAILTMLVADIIVTDMYSSSIEL